MEPGDLLPIKGLNGSSFFGAAAFHRSKSAPPCPKYTTPTSLFFFQVEVEVESMDKAGNFIGWLHIEGVNLSVALVENALSKVHFTAERSSYYKTLVSAEEGCRQRKEKVSLVPDISDHARKTARAEFIPPHLSRRPRLWISAGQYIVYFRQQERREHPLSALGDDIEPSKKH